MGIVNAFSLVIVSLGDTFHLGGISKGCTPLESEESPRCCVSPLARCSRKSYLEGRALLYMCPERRETSGHFTVSSGHAWTSAQSSLWHTRVAWWVGNQHPELPFDAALPALTFLRVHGVSPSTPSKPCRWVTQRKFCCALYGACSCAFLAVAPSHCFGRTITPSPRKKHSAPVNTKRPTKIIHLVVG